MAKNLVNGTSTTIQENGDNISIQINFPIGYIYMSTSSTNPSVYFGGTWVRIAKGQTLIGVDENDNDFSSAKLTGGEKEHTLTIDEMPGHSHNMGAVRQWVGNTGNAYWLQDSNEMFAKENQQTSNVGGGQPHNNLQPYFTCYIWEKTAL